MTVKEFLKAYPMEYRVSSLLDIVFGAREAIGHRPYAKCADGTCYSIQSDEDAHYCTYSDDDELLTVEVACLPEQELLDYCKHDMGLVGTGPRVVYGWVVLDVLEKAIAKHGGIVGIATNEEMWGVRPDVFKQQYINLWDSVRPELCSMSDLQDVSFDRYSNDR